MERRKLIAVLNIAAFAAAALLPLYGQEVLAQGGRPGASSTGKRKARVVYPSRTKLDFDGADIEGELKSPAEFYFQHRPSEKFDSLVKRRLNFHREMLRDVVLSR